MSDIKLSPHIFTSQNPYSSSQIMNNSEAEKKIIREADQLKRHFSEYSNSNNLQSVFEDHSDQSISKKKVNEMTSVPMENDTDLNLERKFKPFTTNFSKDFDQLPGQEQKEKLNEIENELPNKESKEKSKDSPKYNITHTEENKSKEFLQHRSDGNSLDSDSDSSQISPGNSSSKKKPTKHSLQTNKIDSIFLETNSKSRKSNVISFGIGNKGLFVNDLSNNNDSDSPKSKKSHRKKTIKEEEEKDCESLKHLYRPNTDQETVKSYLKGSKNSRASKEDYSICKAPPQKTLYSVISNFYITKKFIMLLRNATVYRRPKWLKSMHFKMINDWSFWEDGWRNADENSENQNNNNMRIKRKLQKIKEKCVKLKNNAEYYFPKTFDPTTKFRVLWDLLHLMIIVFNMIYVPIEVGFDLSEEIRENETMSIVQKFSLCFFFVDLIVNMNTAYYDKGNLIFSRSHIVRNYLKGDFFRDIISFFPQILSLFTIISDYFDLLILLRIYNLKKIFLSIEEFIFVDERMYNTLALLKLIFGVLFLSHLLACIWHFIGYIEKENSNTWLFFYDLMTKPWYIRYLNSYYYVVISMNTVGYGDIVPQSPIEKFYSIFFIYFACWIFAYTLNSIGIILQDINKMNHDYIRNMNLINGYMKQKNINFDLRMRIRKYIQFIWTEEKAHNEVETSQVINKLSNSLRQELLLQANGIILRELPMFHLNFSEETLKKIVYTMKEVSFIPGDTIYNSNDNDDKSLYILRSGEIELYVETPRSNCDPVTIVKTLTKKGEVFGEYSFFSNKERETCARSRNYTSVFIIKQQDVLDILKENTLDYQNYCQIKDQMNLYQFYDGLYGKCHICKENNHQSIECPLLHLSLCKSRIIQKLLYTESQKREPISTRKPTKSSHPLKNFEKHENLAQKLHQYLLSEDEDLSSSVISEESPDSNANSNDTKPSEEEIQPFNTVNNEELPKFNQEITGPRAPILKGAGQLSRVNTNTFNYVESKNSIPQNENVEFMRPETNPVKFFNDMQTNNNNTSNINNNINNFSNNKGVSFFPNLKQQNSDDSISLYSNFSRKSKASNNNIEVRKKMKSQTMDYSKKLTNNVEDDDTSNKSGKRTKGSSSSKIKINREGSAITLDSRKSLKSTDSSRNSLIAGILKKNEEQKETQVMTTTTENKEVLLDDLCKSYENYFPHNNVEVVVEWANEVIERRRKRKKLSKISSKIFANTFESINTREKSIQINSPAIKGRKRINNPARSNFFQQNPGNLPGKPNKHDRRKSLFDKEKIIEFLKEEEKKKMQTMGVWSKVKGIFNWRKKDEDLLSKYSIKGNIAARKNSKPNKKSQEKK